MRISLLFVTLAIVLASLSAPLLADDFYAKLSVGEPHIYGNLAVYPVYYPGGGEKLGDLLTLSEALATGKFKITEISEGASVNVLEVHNKTGKYVVLLAGEIIRGAKQDRIISYDTVVPPVGVYYVDVFCVEAGRWYETSSEFSYKEEIAPSQIRYSAQEKNDQSAVWDDVSSINAEVGVYTESDALTASYSDADFLNEVEKYKAVFEDLADDKEVVGVIVLTEGKVKSGDVFANHDLFKKVWPRLLSSYSMDAVLSAGLGEVMTSGEMEEYLAQLEDADRQETYADDTQKRATLEQGSLSGYELELNEKKVHVNVY